MERITKIKNGRTGPEANTLIRNERVEFKASPEEYELLTQYALKRKYNTLAAYVRETALEGIPLQGTKKTRLEEQKKLNKELGNIGSNINQIAKTLNLHVIKQIGKQNETELLLAEFLSANLDEIKEEFKMIRKVLFKKSR